MPRWATTRRPSHSRPTPSPTASTVPATSRPGTVGRTGSGYGPSKSPERSAVSITWTPAAATAIRTWPGPASGSSVLSYFRLPAGPNAWRRMACTRRFPLRRDANKEAGGRTGSAPPTVRPQPGLRSTASREDPRLGLLVLLLGEVAVALEVG